MITNEEELWLPLPNEIGYQVSSLGRVLTPKGRMLHPTITGSGYLVCDIYGAQKRVNRLVCRTFHGPAPDRSSQAAHRDGCKQNNRQDNLYWATPAENTADKRRHGKILKGDNHPRTKIMAAEVEVIKTRRKNGESIRAIWSEYFKTHGICYATISHIVNGRTHLATK